MTSERGHFEKGRWTKDQWPPFGWTKQGDGYLVDRADQLPPGWRVRGDPGNPGDSRKWIIVDAAGEIAGQFFPHIRKFFVW